MIFIREKHLPFWLDNEESLEFPSAKDGTKVDVAIVGGGIVGITTGFMLKKQGFKVAIIESKTICSDVTGSTTAKLTISSNLIYDDIISNLGMEATLKFKDANILAFDKLSEIVSEYKIDCDYKKIPLYIYSTDKNNFKDIEKEYKALKKLNIDADLTDEFQMPFSEETFHEINMRNEDNENDYGVNKGIRYNNQAIIHPIKYCNELLKLIPGEGSYVFEKTKVTNIEESKNSENDEDNENRENNEKNENSKTNKIITEKGDIFAESVVIATNSPIDDPDSTLSYMSPIKSYILGVYVKEKLPESMFVDINPFHTYRKTPTEKGDLLILAGEHHLTGQGEDTSLHFEKLIEYVNRKFNVESIAYWWSNQDNRTIDGMPVIGETSQKGVYVATGFGSWGIVKSALAGMMLTDLISNEENIYSETFSPKRFKKQKSIKKRCQSSFNRKDLNDEELKILKKEISNLNQDEARIIELPKRWISIYKDLKSNVFTLQANCTHFGCKLSWNSAEKSWDCPQHGSRFDYKGNSIHGPAIRNLKSYLD